MPSTCYVLLFHQVLTTFELLAKEFNPHGHPKRSIQELTHFTEEKL